MDNARWPAQELPPQQAGQAPQQYVDREFAGIVAANFGENAPAPTAAVYGSHVSRGEDFSHESLPHQPERIELVTPYTGHLATNESAAVGMASVSGVDKNGQALQQNKLTYRGLTSEEYAARNAANLAMLHNFLMQQTIELAFKPSEDDEDGDSDKPTAAAKKRKKRKQSRNKSYRLAA